MTIASVRNLSWIAKPLPGLLPSTCRETMDEAPEVFFLILSLHAAKQNSFHIKMSNHTTATARANILMLITAMIWGFAFVAQRAGMAHIGPFAYNAVRFFIGSLSLIPVIYFMDKRVAKRSFLSKTELFSGIAAGLILFFGASFQQIGLVSTSAGNAGFITGVYVVLVPIIGILWRHKTGWSIWIGVVLTVVGMYFLSIKEQMTIERGDLMVLLSTFFWANHVLFIAWISPKIDPIRLSSVQFLVVAIISGFTTYLFEPFEWHFVLDAKWPILYGGLLSVGVAYTLQVVAQRDAHPAYAAIILSSEAIFAVTGGVILLNESMTIRAAFGCFLMLLGMVSAQLPDIIKYLKKE